MTNTTTTTYIGNLKRDFDANMVSLELCATQQIPTMVHKEAAVLRQET